MRPSPTLKIGLSGIRGIVGESLTPQLVTCFASAFGTYAGPTSIIVGTDTRPSREMVTQAAVAGLSSVGCTPVAVGIVPVPTLQHHVRETGAGGGICITASHNPMEWNALKFFGPDGIALRSNQLGELIDLYHQGVYARVPADQITNPTADHSAAGKHEKAILKLVDIDLIRTRKFKVVTDCCNGAASTVTPGFLARLGCEVVELNTDPTRPFPRNPEPTKDNLSALCEAVEASGADIGLAQDADADRLAIVDEKGAALGEDSTIALTMHHFLKRGAAPVVVSLSTSRIVEAVAAQHRVPLYRTKVGEIHVIEKMQECGAQIGGEGSGGVIVPGVNPCRDSFVAMSLILEMLAENSRSIGQLRSELPDYHIQKTQISCLPRDVAPAIRLLRYFYRDSAQDLTDGVRILWRDRWIHVRGSNTEPVIRIVAEANSEDAALALIDQVMDYIRPATGV